jgi:hypothetical protein
MKFLVVLLILQSSLVYAEKKIVEKDLSALSRIDEENLKKVESVKSVNDSSASTTNFSMSCKDTSGKEFKKGDVGYDTCLSGIKAQHDLNKLNSGMNKKDKNDGNSASFNFKVGD